MTKKEIKAWAGLSFWRDSKKMECEALREKYVKGEFSPQRNLKGDVLKKGPNF